MSNPDPDKALQEQIDKLRQQISTSVSQLQLDIGNQFLGVAESFKALSESFKGVGESLRKILQDQAAASNYTLALIEFAAYKDAVRELSSLSGLPESEAQLKFQNYCQAHPLGWRGCFQQIKEEKSYEGWNEWNPQCRFYSDNAYLKCAVNPMGICGTCSYFEPYPDE